MLVFILMARALGPDAFGTFSYCLAVATLLAVPANYGFGIMLLRDFGVDPERATECLGEALTAKLALSLLVFALSAAVTPFLGAGNLFVFALLLLAQVVDSFLEIYNLRFRIHSEYSKETVTASITSVIHIVVMLAVVYFTRSPVAAAAAFLASRLMGCYLTWWRSRHCTGPLSLGPISGAITTLRRGWPYGLEMILLTAYQQIDSVLIHAVLGSAAVGVYQAGMKLVHGACRLAPVLAQVLLPSLSSSFAAGSLSIRSAVKSLIGFAAFGGIGCAVLVIFRTEITHLLFGAHFQDLENLLPLFGLMLLFRFLETGTGLLLVAKGLQHKKTFIVGSHVVLMSGIGYWALKSFSLLGWQLVYVLSLALLVGAYFYLLLRARPNDALAMRETK